MPVGDQQISISQLENQKFFEVHWFAAFKGFSGLLCPQAGIRFKKLINYRDMKWYGSADLCGLEWPGLRVTMFPVLIFWKPMAI